MPDYTDITVANRLLTEAQEAEEDNRERIREVTHFLEKDDGQWEPSIVQMMTGRPRYTFDKCNPVVDSIAGEMEQAEFAIKVRPAGGDASKEVAKVYAGIIRQIETASNATEMVYNAAVRQMVAAGFDCWRVTHEWSNTDSFEQDLFIRKIANSVDRVWFDPGAELQDMSDARYCFVLQNLTKDEYEETFPEGRGMSVGDVVTDQVYAYKPDFVTVGEFLYKKPVTKELVLMSNNSVYEVDDKYKSVRDELAADGVTEVKRRKKKSHVVMSRMFDGSGWLGPEKKLVFSYLPVIPVYANFKISESKVIYRGAVNKLMDAQRVYNYAQSRVVEEGALAPRGKYWMTPEQAATHQATLQTMNTNSDPVQLYTHIDGQNPPFWQGGAQINQGLQQMSSDMSNNIIESSGVFAANQGNAPSQSGYAIELQQNKGDNSTIKYFGSRKIAITHTARILVDAIPKVYDTKRQVRILGEDGSSEMVTLNDRVFDNETQKQVALNDVRSGKYDVVCDIGPAFRNRQQETVRAFMEAAGVYPEIMAIASDIWVGNIDAPGMELAAERIRKRLLESGQIPDAQMTDEEKKRAQALIAQAQAEAQQGPSIMDQALIEQTQANTAEIASRAQERQAKVEIEAEKLRQAEQKMLIDANDKAEKSDLAFQKMMLDQQMAIVDALNKQAQTLKTLKEAMGVGAIMGPSNTRAYMQQAEIVTDNQEKLSTDMEIGERPVD